jgi:hypothetical protein
MLKFFVLNFHLFFITNFRFFSCRRKIISDHFGERWESTDCDQVSFITFFTFKKAKIIVFF